MQLGGRKAGLNRDVVVFQRGDSDFVFEAEALADMEGYEMLCPPPVPPTKILPNGTKVAMTEDAEFKAELNKWAERKYDYMVLRSLSITPGLSWEKVDLDKPSTWHEWRAELVDFGLSWREIERLERLVNDVNTMTEGKLEAARARFFRERAASAKRDVAQG